MDFGNEIRPKPRKSSLSNEMTGKNGNYDENDNLAFIKEEIAPGLVLIFNEFLILIEI